MKQNYEKQRSVLLVFLFILGISTISIGQANEAKKDSLIKLLKQDIEDTTRVNIYLNLSGLTSYQNLEQSEKYAKKALQLSKKINYYSGEFHCYHAVFKHHHLKGSPADSFLVAIQSMEKIAKYITDSSQFIVLHGDYAGYYSLINELDKNVKANIEALRLIKKFNPNPLYEGIILHNIGRNLKKLGDRKEGLAYFFKAAPLFGDNEYKGMNSLGIATTHYELYDDIDTIQIFVDEALAIFEKTNSTFGLIRTKQLKALFFRKKNQSDKALPLLKEAKALAEKNNFGIFNTAIYSEFSNCYYQKKQYSKAIKYGEQAIELMKANDNYDIISNVYLPVYKSYKATNRHKKAFDVLLEYTKLKDEVEQKKHAEEVQKIETQFAVKEKEQENKVLKAETVANKKTIQNRTTTAIALLLGLLLLGSWAAVIWRTNRQKQKYNEELEATVVERTAELQKANKNLEQANYELRTFNYIASHDIKEPIRNIGSYVSLIRRKLPKDLKEKLGDYFKTIKRSTNQLYTLIEDFAYYSTLSQDEVIESKAVDLNFLTENVVESLAETVARYKGQVIVNDLPTINSRNSLLFTALKNLIENGLKYNQSEKPTVEISYSATAIHHQITISDNGIGIDEQYHERIFEMFKRLHNRGEYEGSGIGLAIVKLVISKLEGTITTKSVVNQGSQFILKLPIKV